MNKIYLLGILLWFVSCKEEKCSLENGVTNFDSTPDVEEEILHQYPVLEKEDLEACKQFAIQLMERKYTLREIAA